MIRGLLSLVCGFALLSGAFALGENDPNDDARFVQDGPNEYTFSWLSHPGRTYFVQHSENFVIWTYFLDGLVPGGDGEDPPRDATAEYGFSVSGTDRFFVRVIHIEYPGNDPAGEDFDGDKVSNQYELDNGTDPLRFVDNDSDGDGMSDAWETEYRLNPNNPGDGGPTADADEDGTSNRAEYEAGTDPTNYYYNGFPNVFRVASGNFQTAEPGTFSPNPLIIELKNGTTPVNDGPITVQIKEGSSGQISDTNNGAGLETVLHLRTNSSGQVAVYFKNPTVVPGGELTSYIQAKIGSAARHGFPQIQEIGEITQVNYTYPSGTVSNPLGTVGWNATQAIDTRIAATNPNADFLPVYSTQDNATPEYVRNTASWCYDLRQPMTCISPWNSLGLTGRAGTAITPQHVVCAQHFPLDRGVTIRFITANNVVVLGTIRGRYNHPTADVSVYTLDTPLPATITPCQVFPTNYADYLSYLGGGRPPVMFLDKEEKALVHEFRAIDTLHTFAIFAKPIYHTARLPFYEDWEDGDSGDPAFLIVNNTLVLLSTATGGGPGSGPFMTNLTNPTLNGMIVAADADATAHGYPTNTGLQVQTIDLSGFSPFTSP